MMGNHIKVLAVEAAQFTWENVAAFSAAIFAAILTLVFFGFITSYLGFISVMLSWLLAIPFVEDIVGKALPGIFAFGAFKAIATPRCGVALLLLTLVVFAWIGLHTLDVLADLFSPYLGVFSKALSLAEILVVWIITGAFVADAFDN